MSSLQAVLLRQAKSAQSGVPSAPGTAAGGAVTGGESSAQPVERAKKTWVINADPAIYDHQGGGYKLLTSFALTLKDKGISHYSDNIGDKAGFIAAWKEKASHTLGMNEEEVGSIDEERLDKVIRTFTRIDNEWAGYPVSTRPQTFRGDGLSIADSFPWLQDIIKLGEPTEVTKIDMNITETAPTIMSTSGDKDCNYAKKAQILWKFSLPEGQHQGISKPLYASEDEVTFPIYNRMNVKSVTVIPEGQSFDSETNGTGFGNAHRYVIEAEMLPKSGVRPGSASAG
jgi:insecticidal toxin complex protein TccC